jgi:hypothetical protein
MQRSQRPLPTPDPENSRHTIPLLAANPIGTAECALRTSAPEMLCQIGADPNNLFFAVGVNVAGVPVEPSRPRRHIEICLDGDLGALSAEQLAAIVADACRRSGGLAVRIVCITEGSIRLVLSFDQDAAVVFKSLYDGQRLFQLNGFRVSTELLGRPGCTRCIQIDYRQWRCA